MTWYRGGKYDRHVMLSRYNTQTGAVATIEFPHQHTGFRGEPLVGESHNTIGLAISPINGSIHMVYDMHAYTNTNHGGKFTDDYFRYSYSVAGAAEVADNEFTLNKFVRDTSSISQGSDDYKHLTMTGNLADKSNFASLTYPTFFTNTDGTLLLYMRTGGNNNGGYVFNRYDAANQKWSKFTQFNVVTAKNFGNAYNWGLYGHMKYVNGKLRVGFQQRSSVNNDRYKYQNGVYYAYSDHPEGNGNWKNHQGQNMTFPLVNSDEIKVFEPGDYITGHNDANSVYIVGNFDWTVTANGDIHMISQVRSSDRNRADYQEVDIHSYKPAGANNFIHSTDFTGATDIYTAGDNVYIIGLNNGYPYVEKAAGGTNNFVSVYQQTQGTKFDHGRVHIDNGKLYYYLMEKSSGTAQPLYLQIIDLDINPGPDGYTYAANEGDTVNVTGTMNIAFGVDDQFNYVYGVTEDTHCHRNVFGDPAPGVVKKCYVQEVIDQTPVVSFNQGAITLDEGYEELMLSVDVTSPTGAAIDNVKLYRNGVFIRQESVAPYEWGHAGLPNELLGLSAGSYSFKAVATDVNGIEGIKFKIVNINEVSTPAGCSSVTDITWNTQTEITLSGNNSCIHFDQSLTGKTVQFWDSDENNSCNFNGTISSVDGNGSVNVTSTYKQSSDYTGTILKLVPSNNCMFIKVRAY